MSKKWFLALVLGYVAGIAVAARFAPTPPPSRRRGRAQPTLAETIITIHRELLDWIEERTLSDEAREQVRVYRTRLQDELGAFRTDAMARIQSLGDRTDIERELSDLYDRRVEILEWLRSRVDSVYEDARRVGTRAWDDARVSLESSYRTIRDEMDTIRREFSDEKK